ncbi:SDR family NAD(P)-dependent oxidoreductase [Mycolicibacterium obuense]|uniref:3-oxoacyl-[acyl-carrier-protein] reductase FabG n=1 Tax=Mycolicibacterium obuense TaxID=1807 RepID=A0A0J6VEW9_9MYCO|nr:SDR family oxidoreductase [Mycolicibacterium obuense]KMO69555.1 3-oxoacyl-[acyl-carrier-protein] reductase FabG [Mycolicibacterium obuense]
MSEVKSATKQAIVTGVSSGIGAAIAERLLADGWRVLGLSRRKPALDDDRFDWCETDMADFGQIQRHLAGLQTVDAVIHAAGVQFAAPVGELDLGHSAQMWRIHVGAAEALVDTLASRIADGGRIVLIGSRTMSGNPGKSQYAATKSALTGMARSWAAELVTRGITVNVVAPGPTDTPMLADPNRARTPATVPPMGRLIDSGEVAGLVAFLLGADARSITGQVITQCAGLSL